MNMTVIVTGMHRSGTSFLGSVLHASGIDMGDRLVGAGRGNCRGHFEDADIVKFHQQILDRGWSPDHRELPQPGCADRNAATDLVAQRMHKSAWGFKDPRAALFLDFWNELLGQVRWIFVVRDPFAVVRSLHRRDDDGRWWWRADSRRLSWWRWQTAECLSFAARHADRCLVLELEQAVDDMDACGRALSQFLNREIKSCVLRDHFDASLLTRRTSLFSTFATPWDCYRAMQVHRRARSMSAVQ